LGSIKLKISAFKGKTDPEAYLDWEKKGGDDFLHP
jgi:hypothetical protein